jgi:hypothetical protein
MGTSCEIAQIKDIVLDEIYSLKEQLLDGNAQESVH